LSVKPLIKGEFCHCAIANVEPITIPSAAPAPTSNTVGLDADIAILRIPELFGLPWDDDVLIQLRT